MLMDGDDICMPFVLVSISLQYHCNNCAPIIAVNISLCPNPTPYKCTLHLYVQSTVTVFRSFYTNKIGRKTRL